MAFYQPQKHDVVIYDAVLDLLGINAESKGEKDLYRQTLGEVVFGDARYFGDGDVFSLAPIRNVGPDILNCEDIEGVTRVRLLEVVRVIPGDVPRIDIQKSSDLYRAHGTRWQEALQRGRITSAKFGFLFEDFEPRAQRPHPPRTPPVTTGIRTPSASSPGCASVGSSTSSAKRM